VNILAKNLEFLREVAGLSIGALVDAAGVSLDDYLEWARGDTLPQAEQLKKLTDFYELDIKEVFSKTFIEDYVFVHPEATFFDPDSSEYQGRPDEGYSDEEVFSDEELEEEYEPEEGYDEEEPETEEEEYEEPYEEELDEEPEEEYVPRDIIRRSRKPASRYLDADEEEEQKPPRVRVHAKDDGEYVAIEREMYVPIGRRSSKKTKTEPKPQKRVSKKPKSRARVSKVRDSQSPLWEQVVTNEKIRRAVLEDEENTVVPQKAVRSLENRTSAKREYAPVKEDYQDDVISSEDISRIGINEYDMTAYDMPDMNIDPDLFKPERKQIDYNSDTAPSKSALPYEDKNQTGSFDVDTGGRTDLTAGGGTSLSEYFDTMTPSSGTIRGDAMLAENKESDFDKISAPIQEQLNFVGPQVQTTEQFMSQPVQTEMQSIGQAEGQPANAEGWTVIYQDNRVVQSEEELNTPIVGQHSLFNEEPVAFVDKSTEEAGVYQPEVTQPEAEPLQTEVLTQPNKEVASYDLNSFEGQSHDAQAAAAATAVAAGSNGKPQYIKNIYTTNDNPIAIATCLSVVLLLSLFLPLVRSGGQTFMGFALFEIDIIRAILVVVLAVMVVAFLIDISVMQYKVLAAQNIVDKRFAMNIRRNSIIYAVFSLALVVALLVLSLGDFELGMIVLGVVEFFFALSCILIAVLTRRAKVGSKKRAIIRHNSYQMENNYSKNALLITSIITIVLWVVLALFVAIGIIQTISGHNVLQQIGVASAQLWWLAELFAGFVAMLLGHYVLIVLMGIVILGILGLQISNILLYKKLARGSFDEKPHTAKELRPIRRHGITNLGIGAGLYIAAFATLLGLIFGDYQNTWFAHEYGVLIILTVVGALAAYKLTIYIRLYKCFEPTDGGEEDPRLWLSFDKEGNLHGTHGASGPEALNKILEENKTKQSFTQAREDLARSREAAVGDAAVQETSQTDIDDNFNAYVGPAELPRQTEEWQPQQTWEPQTQNFVQPQQPMENAETEYWPQEEAQAQVTAQSGTQDNEETVVLGGGSVATETQDIGAAEDSLEAPKENKAEDLNNAAVLETASTQSETTLTQVEDSKKAEELPAETESNKKAEAKKKKPAKPKEPKEDKKAETKSEAEPKKVKEKAAKVSKSKEAEQSAAEVIKEVIEEETAEKDTIDDILDRIEKEINSKGKPNKGGGK
jgi:transcriptional regulator with XRE-family HTH domain